MKLLVTGSAGLMGSVLRKSLSNQRIETIGIDLKSQIHLEQGDIRDGSFLEKQMEECDGIIHLAAISRVVHAQNNPQKCWNINVEGTRNLLKIALSSSKKPWVIFASSREVHGQQDHLPVHEEAGFQPVNVYGYAKVAAEMECLYSRSLGLQTATVRFSNVYGGENDHDDLVIPAFVRAALSHAPLRVEGVDNVFDFTHVNDVVQGLVKLIDVMNTNREKALPPIHFLTGKGTTLGELSDIIRFCSDSRSSIRHAPARDFDVHSFIGDPQRAKELLGWSAEISLEDGILQLTSRLREAA